jgi:anti-sigma factor RsiW
MSNQDIHLSDQEMLQTADGEISARGARRVQAHLTACWTCRGRMAEIEKTIASFARAHRSSLDAQLPSISGPRALLRARLAEPAGQREVKLWARLLHIVPAGGSAAAIGTAFLIAVLAASFVVHRFAPRIPNSAVAANDRGILPDPRLTPGAARRVIAMSDVCSMPHDEVVAEVSTSLRQEVLQRYGIPSTRASDYEIDYLITPGLGGVEAISNLWPEAYGSRTWNAHVKDDLEEHLHEMVCDGKLDLSEAQRDIATDWIAAYKKYFRTDQPLVLHSDLTAGGTLELRPTQNDTNSRTGGGQPLPASI